jgi:hypothetical protein
MFQLHCKIYDPLTSQTDIYIYIYIHTHMWNRENFETLQHYRHYPNVFQLVTSCDVVWGRGNRTNNTLNCVYICAVENRRSAETVVQHTSPFSPENYIPIYTVAQGNKNPKFSNFGGFCPILDFGAHCKPQFFLIWAWGLNSTQSYVGLGSTNKRWSLGVGRHGGTLKNTFFKSKQNTTSKL